MPQTERFDETNKSVEPRPQDKQFHLAIGNPASRCDENSRYATGRIQMKISDQILAETFEIRVDIA